MQILDLLWNLAHLPHVSREMVELALDAHSSILIESYSTKESERRTYIGKCVEDIRKVRTFSTVGTPLIQIPVGQKKVSILVKCTLRGELY